MPKFYNNSPAWTIYLLHNFGRSHAGHERYQHPGGRAVIPMPQRPLPDKPTLLLVLDEVSTPGNLGTMLRTAGAAGADGVLLGPGCVDLYNPKVVRGSMGAHLRLPVHSQSWAEIAKTVRGMQVWVATVQAERPYTAARFGSSPPRSSLAARRPARARRPALATGHITIPMHAATESLNAAMAAGIILFEAARQRAFSRLGQS